ncbi:unnamed protein product [Ceutorhynchus assimilis]|uniref:Uncharacterized protein n=1 Tax=Ceutorhynchus assimilis TaxID=467358 RepID=A0A9N9MX57_9CUCU|nr:unnamed protein product [Ceutorhynchus assimilis]
MSARTKKNLSMCNTKLETQSCSMPKNKSCDTKNVIGEPLTPMTVEDFGQKLNSSLDSEESNTSEENNNGTSEEDNNSTSEEPEEQSDVGRGTKRKLHQKRRLLGEAYLGYRRPKNQKRTFQDTERNARVMGPMCLSNACKRSKKRWCQDLSEIQRQQIFKNFWGKLNSWEQKRVYVLNLVYRKETERKRTTNESSRRSSSLFYKLNIESKYVPVCKKMFLNTLGLKEWTVQNWVKNSAYGTPAPSRSSQPRCKNEDSIQFLITFLDELPKLPSHYCRKDTKKLYLEQTFTSFADLFKLYQEHCKNSQKQALSRNTLMKYVKIKNIGIFSPRKDQCDLCVEYQAGNLDQSVWEKHRNEKQRAQEEKNNDKELAILDECHVICMDLQAVKTCPYLQASSLYFKTKLCCHNYTVFDLKTKDAVCYWFDETDTDLQASTFASLLVDFLKRKYLENNTNQQKPIIIFSDGCTYQNRNAVLANALLALSYQYDVRIIQKFLVKGHTNMECDSVHATIEKKLKNKTISIPNDYHRITAEARANPKPFEVVCPTFEFFYNFNEDLVYESIRPGRKLNEPTVTDIRALKYEKGEIQYKLSFEDNFFIPLPQRPKKAIKKIEEFRKLYTEKLPITQKKYTHLQEIKTKLHKNYWPFYDNLLHK